MAKAVWVKKNADSKTEKLLIGAKYTQINEAERRRILNFARKIVALPKLTAGALVVLIAVSVLFYFSNSISIK